MIKAALKCRFAQDPSFARQSKPEQRNGTCRQARSSAKFWNMRFFGSNPISGVLADHVLTADSPVFEHDAKEQETLAGPVDTQISGEKLAQKSKSLFLKHQSYLPEDAKLWHHRHKGTGVCVNHPFGRCARGVPSSTTRHSAPIGTSAETDCRGGSVKCLNLAQERPKPAAALLFQRKHLECLRHMFSLGSGRKADTARWIFADFVER